MHFGADVVVPDVAGWRTERIADWSDAAYLIVAPDWVCEVLSSTTERIDRTERLAIYAHEGVQHVRLLDPSTRTLEILRREGISLSAQCGFASTEDGNVLSEDEQWRKLELVVAVARDVWG